MSMVNIINNKKIINKMTKRKLEIKSNITKMNIRKNIDTGKTNGRRQRAKIFLKIQIHFEYFNIYNNL